MWLENIPKVYGIWVYMFISMRVDDELFNSFNSFNVFQFTHSLTITYLYIVYCILSIINKTTKRHSLWAIINDLYSTSLSLAFDTILFALSYRLWIFTLTSFEYLKRQNNLLIIYIGESYIYAENLRKNKCQVNKQVS